MPRPCKHRQVCGQPGPRLFLPAGVPPAELTWLELALDELEALRLADLAGLHQDEAALAMGVSRATLGRILASARAKVAAALVQGFGLRIGGGPVEMSGPGCRCGHCHATRLGWRCNQGEHDGRK
jgi:uncharacterized protein